MVIKQEAQVNQADDQEVPLYVGAGRFVAWMLKNETTDLKETLANVGSYLRDLRTQNGAQFVETVVRIARSEVRDQPDLLKLIDPASIDEMIDQQSRDKKTPLAEIGIIKAFEILANNLKSQELFADIEANRQEALPVVRFCLRKYGQQPTYQALDKLKQKYEQQPDSTTRALFLRGIQKQIDLIRNIRL